MNILRENKSQANDVIQIDITAEDYKAGFEKKIKKYAKEMAVPGFRKGFVPVGMIKKMYGEAILAEEINHLADDAINNFVKENQIKLLGRPMLADGQEPIDIKPNEDRSYQLRFEIGYEAPFELNLSGHTFDRCEIDVTTEMVDKEVENVFGYFTSLTDSEEPIAEGDSFYFDVMRDGEKLSESFATTEELTEAGKAIFAGKKKEDEVALKLLEAFDNTKLNVKRYILNLKDEDAISDEDMQLVTTLKITNVKKKTKPTELTAEQIQQVTRDESKTTMEELRVALEDDIKKQYSNLATNFLRNDVYEYVTSHTNMDLPADFLKRWMISEKENNLTAEKVEKDFPAIEKSIKWDLITSKYALEKEVKVEIEEVKNEFRQRYLGYFANSGYTPPADQLDKFIADAMKDQQSVRKTFETLLDTKVLDKMIEGIQTKAVKMTEDQFIAESKKRNEKNTQEQGEEHVHDEHCGHDH